MDSYVGRTKEQRLEGARIRRSLGKEEPQRHTIHDRTHRIKRCVRQGAVGGLQEQTQTKRRRNRR